MIPQQAPISSTGKYKDPRELLRSEDDSTNCPKTSLSEPGCSAQEGSKAGVQILYPQSLECLEARDGAEVKGDQAALEDRKERWAQRKGRAEHEKKAKEQCSKQESWDGTSGEFNRTGFRDTYILKDGSKPTCSYSCASGTPLQCERPPKKD